MVDAGKERWDAYYYFGVCSLGGMLSAGTTHLAITPLDVLKVNMQVNPVKYSGISSGFSTLWKEQGPASLWRGWSGKLIGYGVQGGCKFGLYEFFKRLYSSDDDHVLAADRQSRTFIFFISSASAQVFADVALCPFEAVKVQVQTQPSFAKGLADGFPKLYKAEGLTGFYRGMFPLWCRNIPFSMVMFSTFEHSADLLYGKMIQRRKEECSKIQQLGVTCLAGYAAGAVGTVVSNPADNIVSSLYTKKAHNVLQAVKNIGVANLFTRSLPIRLTLVGPVVTLQLGLSSDWWIRPIRPDPIRVQPIRSVPIESVVVSVSALGIRTCSDSDYQIVGNPKSDVTSIYYYPWPSSNEFHRPFTLFLLDQA